MDQNSPSPSQRRTFLISMIGSIGVALAALFSWPVWQYLSPQKGADQSEQVAIPRSSVEPGGAHFFNFHGQPAVVLQPSPGSFVALSAVCTHLGCVVKWVEEAQEFLCPCHAGRFSKEGVVIGGPPPKPLETLPVTLEGDQVLIG